MVYFILNLFKILLWQHDSVHGIFSEYRFDLVVAMLLFGLLGVMFVVDEYHVAMGVLVADITIVS